MPSIVVSTCIEKEKEGGRKKRREEEWGEKGKRWRKEGGGGGGDLGSPTRKWAASRSAITFCVPTSVSSFSVRPRSCSKSITHLCHVLTVTAHLLTRKKTAIRVIWVDKNIGGWCRASLIADFTTAFDVIIWCFKHSSPLVFVLVCISLQSFYFLLKQLHTNHPQQPFSLTW